MITWFFGNSWASDRSINDWGWIPWRFSSSPYMINEYNYKKIKLKQKNKKNMHLSVSLILINNKKAAVTKYKWIYIYKKHTSSQNSSIIVTTTFCCTCQGLYMAHKSADVIDNDCKRWLEAKNTYIHTIEHQSTMNFCVSAIEKVLFFFFHRKNKYN